MLQCSAARSGRPRRDASEPIWGLFAFRLRVGSRGVGLRVLRVALRAAKRRSSRFGRSFQAAAAPNSLGARAATTDDRRVRAWAWGFRVLVVGAVPAGGAADLGGGWCSMETPGPYEART